MDAIWKMLVITTMDPRERPAGYSLTRDKSPENHVADIEMNGKQAGLALRGHHCAGRSDTAEAPFLPKHWYYIEVFLH